MAKRRRETTYRKHGSADADHLLLGDVLEAIDDVLNDIGGVEVACNVVVVGQQPQAEESLVGNLCVRTSVLNQATKTIESIVLVELDADVVMAQQVAESLQRHPSKSRVTDLVITPLHHLGKLILRHLLASAAKTS